MVGRLSLPPVKKCPAPLKEGKVKHNCYEIVKKTDCFSTGNCAMQGFDSTLSVSVAHRIKDPPD